MSLKSIWASIVQAFKNGQSKASTSAPAPAAPAANIPPMQNGEIDYLDWCARAMKVSGSFEGTGEDWGNPVGNFDGALLTCGLMGFTWKYNNQPPMILDFVKRYGEAKAKQLMPQTWAQYYDAAKRGEKDGGATVASWSTGKGEGIKEPYRSELKAFWSSEEMKKIQVEKSWSMMGAFAQKKAIETQKYFGLQAPLFAHFCYWFDQAVLNGTGNTIGFDEANGINPQSILDWMKNETGYIQNDFDRNRLLWAEMIKTASVMQIHLWIMAKLRAKKSKEEFDTVVMCRRGALALGRGWVNGSLRDFTKTFSLVVAPQTPVKLPLANSNAVLLALAAKVGQDAQMEKLLRFKLANRPDSNPRYWAIADFSMNSNKKRLFVFDVQENTVRNFTCAHGRGSDENNDGIADKFSNVNGSGCSSLGIYLCAEPYTSDEHGLAMRLDGLESTNSNARERAIVMHGATYVTDDRAGRSLGCPAIDNKYRDDLIPKLQGGSLLLIHD